MISKTGIFTVSGGRQDVAHTLGDTPTLVILWTTATLSTSYKNGFDFAWGAYDGTTSRSFASHRTTSVAAGSTTSYTSTYTIAASVGTPGTVVLAGTITSWNATTFHIEWAASLGYKVHFIAFTGVTAKVGEFARPGSAIDKVVTGVGFKADLVLLFSTNSTAIPQTAISSYSMGAFNKHGEQYAAGFNVDAARSIHRSDACTVNVDSSGATLYSANFVSMNQDGFTLHYTTNADTAITFYIAINGVNSSISEVAKSTDAATASQVVTADTLTPKGEALLMITNGSAAASGTASTGIHFSMGFSDGSNVGTCSGSVASGAHEAQTVENTSKFFKIGRAHV